MRLGHLMDLAPNWNSYGAKEVTPQAAQETVMVLSQVMFPETIPPAMVPMASGGVQLEWHDKGIDLEIYIAADGSVTASVEDSSTGIEWEGALDSDDGQIARALKKLV